MRVILLLSLIFLVVLSTAKCEKKEKIPLPNLENLQNVDIESIILNSDAIPKKVKPRIVTFGFQTRLDHFNPADHRLVDFQYKANIDYFQTNSGPIYIYFKDFSDLSTTWIEDGLMLDRAYIHNGGLFTADYRFFGDNVPTGISDASYENLRLLTVDQIVADIPYFIQGLRNRNYFGNVIAFGSGFGGAIATFARLRFPHLINAAWSSDGLIKFQPTAPVFYLYLSIDLNSLGRNCNNKVYQGIAQMRNILALGNEDERQELEESLNLCGPINTTSTQAIAYFLDEMVEAVATTVAYRHLVGFEFMCDDLQAIDDPLETFIRWYKYEFHTETCRELRYESFIERLSNTEFNTPGLLSGERQTFYLICTQLGLLKETSFTTFNFPSEINLEYRLQTCLDIFGTPTSVQALSFATEHLRLNFGTDFPEITNIIYTNGYINSWLNYQVTFTSGTPESYARILQHNGKSGDLPPIDQKDPYSTNIIKEEVAVRMSRWSFFTRLNSTQILNENLKGMENINISNNDI